MTSVRPEGPRALRSGFLSGPAVAARAPTPLYRTSRFVRRNAVAVAAMVTYLDAAVRFWAELDDDSR